jgi:succinate dehydrogenase / fumarate reductase flavoprotein subunit
VFGLRSGIGAACEMGERPDPEGGGWKEGFERLEERVSRGDGGDVDEIRRGVQRVGALTIGQIRDGDRLERALVELGDLERENDGAKVAGDAPCQWWECMRKIHETGNLIEVARMLTVAALERKESRGGHFRFDYPDLDDDNWKYNIILSLEDGRIVPRRVEVQREEAKPPPGAASTAAMP